MNNDALISIIVPVYNKPKDLLTNCIRSILNQTLEKIQLIIIDDGSNNGCEIVCRELASKDDRIILVHKENGGVSSARNEGLEIATSQYIMFIDCDDWIESNCCEIAYKAAIDYDLDLTFWTYYKEYENFRELYCPIVKDKLNIYDLSFLGSTCKVLYKKEVIGSNRFDSSLKNGEDVEFNFRVFKRAKVYQYIDKPLYHYIIKEDSAVRKFDEMMQENYSKTLNKIKVNCNSREDDNVYFSFMAISYLMIVLNAIVSEKNNKSFIRKINEIKQLSVVAPYVELKTNLSKVELPFTRKIAVICMKYNFYLGTFFVIWFKKKMDSRRV